MLRLASIDVGSNAMRLQIFDVPRQAVREGTIDSVIAAIQEPPNLERTRIPVRLGLEAFKYGRFSPEKVEEVVEAFKYFKHEMTANSVDYYLCAATSASREAANGNELAQRVLEETGILFRLIDGLEENRLVTMALAPNYPLEEHNDMFIDLGGGSLEIKVREKGVTLYQDSLPLGTVRLMIEAGGDEEKMVPLIEEKLEVVKHFFSKTPVPLDYYLVPGGNASDLVWLATKFLHHPPSSDPHTQSMPVQKLVEVLDLIKPVVPRLRQFRFNLRQDRADVIFQAGVIFKTLAEHVGVPTIHVPNVNLNYGILYDLIDRLHREYQRAGQETPDSVFRWS